MEKLFLEAPYLGKVKLSSEVIKYLQKYPQIAAYSSIQFVNQLEQVKEQLSLAGINVIKTGQLLGCSVIDDDVDAYLYIGDGQFHPQALAYSSDSEVVCYNPKSDQFEILSQKNVEKVLKIYQGALTKFHASSTIGVIVSLKPGQEFYPRSLKLEQKFPQKKFYYFIDNNLSFDQLENFNFIEVWVNTACPRIAYDDQDLFRKNVVNLRDVL